jgi:hypothetical protein
VKFKVSNKKKITAIEEGMAFKNFVHGIRP